MEAECEELRILQTLTPLVSTELLVTGQWLAKVRFIAVFVFQVAYYFQNCLKIIVSLCRVN